jgi:hypothetical protein
MSRPVVDALIGRTASDTCSEYTYCQLANNLINTRGTSHQRNTTRAGPDNYQNCLAQCGFQGWRVLWHA